MGAEALIVIDDDVGACCAVALFVGLQLECCWYLGAELFCYGYSPQSEI